MVTPEDLQRLESKMDQIIDSAPIGRWLTVQEALRYAKIKSRTTLNKWINEGYIYAHKRTGEWIIDRKSIDDWYGSEKY